MFLGSSCYQCGYPLCDGLQLCRDTHFDTWEDYADCVTAANTTYDDCITGCGSGRDYGAELVACDDACDATFSTGIAGCNTASEGCAAACLAALADCDTPHAVALAACGDDQTTCYDGCQTTYDGCQGPADSEFVSCQDAATSANADCIAGCMGDGDCIRECNAAEAAALTACSDTYLAESMACSDARTSCRSDCDTAHTACVAVADGDYATCVAGNMATYAACISGCSDAYAACTTPKINAHHRCLFDCETAFEEDPLSDDLSAAPCEKNCCETADGDPPSFSKCSETCREDYDNCQLPAVTAKRTCLFTCLEIEETASWPTGGTIESRICENDCNATYEKSARDCSVDRSECNRECSSARQMQYKCCGNFLNRCYLKCEEPFQEGARDCADTQTDADATCYDTWQECGGGGACDDAYAACLAASYTAYRTCYEPLVSTRYDCRFTCCIDARGVNKVATEYQTCWHSSDCQKNDPVHSVDCQDALDACLTDQPGFWPTDDPPHHLVAKLECDHCGTEAAADYSDGLTL